MNFTHHRQKRNYGLPYLSLFFCVLIFSRNGQLIQGRDISSKRGYDRFPWPFTFLRMPWPSFCIWSHFWFELKARPVPTAGTPLAGSQMQHIYFLPAVLLNHCASWAHQNSVLVRHHEHCGPTECPGRVNCRFHSDHLRVPLSHSISLTNKSPKTEFLRIPS